MKDTVYSKENCPPCKLVKEFLDVNNLLDSVDIQMVGKDISIEDFLKLGFKSTPSMITKDGKKVVNSYFIMNYFNQQENDK